MYCSYDLAECGIVVAGDMSAGLWSASMSRTDSMTELVRAPESGSADSLAAVEDLGFIGTNSSYLGGGDWSRRWSDSLGRCLSPGGAE